MNSPFSLEGETILVTGASSGIGRAKAIECSKAGAKVILLGRSLALYGRSRFSGNACALVFYSKRV